MCFFLCSSHEGGSPYLTKFVPFLLPCSYYNTEAGLILLAIFLMVQLVFEARGQSLPARTFRIREKLTCQVIPN
jgi:hypothetical protein